MLDAIYSSKLYKLSTRKSVISAATTSPMNVELVKQLRSYLDEEYQNDEYLDIGNPDVPEEDTEERIKPSEESSSGGGGGGSVTHIGGEGSLSGELKDAEQDESGPTPPPSDEGKSDVGESVRLKSSKVISSYVSRTSVSESIASQLDNIKGTLNLRSDTSGVVRVVLRVSESELWIYYNDDTNLNNVMEPVIMVLASQYGDCMTFNRLARTDNAIVFEVCESSNTSITSQDE